MLTPSWEFKMSQIYSAKKKKEEEIWKVLNIQVSTE